jgi:hypothetical protein
MLSTLSTRASADTSAPTPTRSTRFVRHAIAAALVACVAAGCETEGRPVASKPGSTKSSVTKSRPDWDSSPGAVR